jgi:pilus assembly protein CpaB
MSSFANKLKSPWVLMLGATLLAGGIAYVAYLYLVQREARIKEEVASRAMRLQGPKAAVVVPRVNAKAGTPVELDVFVSRDIDADLVYPDTVTTRDFDSVRGQKLARDIQQGRPLRLADLQAPEIKDVAGILPQGTRAVTIAIDDMNSIAQTLQPGHRVDVFLVSKFEPAKGVDIPEEARQQVSVFMQNLKVIATGKEFQNIEPAQLQRSEQMVRPGEMRRDGQGFDTVTVLVTPREAQRLLMGSKIGAYRVALRGKTDEATVTVPTLMAGDVMPGGNTKDRGVEYIVGGRGGGGAANLVPTMVPTQLAALGALGAAAAAARTPDNRDIKAGVTQSLREVTTPQRRVGSSADKAMQN